MRVGKMPNDDDPFKLSGKTIACMCVDGREIIFTTTDGMQMAFVAEASPRIVEGKIEAVPRLRTVLRTENYVKIQK